VNSMAILTIIDEKRVLDNAKEIREYLAPIGIEYDCWDLSPEVNKDSTSEAILEAYKEPIERLKDQGGYAKVDVVNVNSSTPGLDAMLAKFSSEHWHDEEEVRFIVYGRGVYHVNPRNGGSIAKLEVEAGDMIRVPRGALHWFDLCADREIKAIRFFQDPAGWTPYYTESGLEKQYEPVCFGLSYLPAERVSSFSWQAPK
jgi:1,2-dihydroxy-3-keto-5-methylthiopentene dioxygenase